MMASRSSRMSVASSCAITFVLCPSGSSRTGNRRAPEFGVCAAVDVRYLATGAAQAAAVLWPDMLTSAYRRA